MLHQSNNLDRVKQERLRRLFDSDGLDILIEVIESEAFRHECDAANKMVENCAGYESLAKESVRRALVNHECIAILKKLRDSKSPFTTATAKPNTKPTEI